MRDRLMAFLAICLLAGFLGILAYRVPRLDLGLVVGITFLFVVYDFFLSKNRAGR